MALRLRIERRPPPLRRFFSSSPPEEKDKDPKPSSVASHFSDVRATLEHQHSEDHPLRRPTPRRSFLGGPSQEQIEELRKRLSVFLPAVGPPPPHSAPSFQRSYQQNDLADSDNSDSRRNAMQISMDKIKESLRGISDRVNASAPGRNGLGSSGGDGTSLSSFTETLRLKPEETNKAASWKIAGGVGKGKNLPLEVFGKEIKEKKEAKVGKQNDSLEKTRFLKRYEYEELGEKLRMLRNPADEGMNGFSLEKLNERLVRSKEMEEQAKESEIKILRKTFSNMKIAVEEEKKNHTQLEILRLQGATPNYTRHPPKEHLFEKDFHPDNISALEKLKVQLAKARERWKLSE